MSWGDKSYFFCLEAVRRSHMARERESECVLLLDLGKKSLKSCQLQLECLHCFFFLWRYGLNSWYIAKWTMLCLPLNKIYFFTLAAIHQRPVYCSLWSRINMGRKTLLKIKCVKKHISAGRVKKIWWIMALGSAFTLGKKRHSIKCYMEDVYQLQYSL